MGLVETKQEYLMARYKVIQDVEDEDKLIGPLTMKQFLYATVAFLIGLGGWFLGKYTNYYLVAPIFLAMIPFIALALPLKQDQPNDVWLLARLNFIFKPRTRLWLQTSDFSPAVNIVADRGKDDENLEDGRTQEEIETQVRQLSQILDSRGHSAALAKSPAATIDSEHELQNSSLGQRFQKLLHHRKAKRLKGIEQNMLQTLRSQDYHLSQYAPGGGQAVEQRSVPEHLTDHLDNIAKVESLRISTLESIIKSAKAKSGRTRPQSA